ncbi:MAG: ASPIC/UnbV domain protein, partial [Gemmatimonadetes bacterium]|nr:ASPIC/UnbV domain protein [Gemmatimonadota bacterium]
MTPIVRRAWAVYFSIALLAATSACKGKPASVEELYTTRTAALGYLRRNQLPEAEAEFKKLTELAPDDPLGYANLGLTYLQGARYPEAEKQLRRARELDPGSTEVGLMLAKLYALTGRATEARATLEQLRRDTVGDAHVLYALAQLDAKQGDDASARRYRDRLRDVLEVAPANLATRLALVQAFARGGAADSAVRELEEVRRIPPEPPKEARAYLDSAIQQLRAGDLPRARTALDHLSRLMEVTAPYQASLEEVKWSEGPIAGRPVLTFAPKDFISTRGPRTHATVDSARFADATLDAGFASSDARAGAPSALAAGDVDGDGRDDLFISTGTAAGKAAVHLYRVQGGSVQDATERSRIVLPQGAAFATFADYDNDGWLDLFVIGGEGRGHLFRNAGNGTFAEVTTKAAIGDVKGARKALFVDLDHDGDLDLLLVGGAQRTVYRNNLDGTFTESTASFGLAGGESRDAAFGDFDGDGRVDLFITSDQGSDALLHNGGAQHFSDVTASSGLASGGGSGPTAVGDYNNDGFLDLVVTSAKGDEPSLLLNKGDGTFARDIRSSAAMQALRSSAGSAVVFVDYDNDGWLDLVVGTSATGGKGSAGLFLFRNDGTGR